MITIMRLQRVTLPAVLSLILATVFNLPTGLGASLSPPLDRMPDFSLWRPCGHNPPLPGPVKYFVLGSPAVYWWAVAYYAGSVAPQPMIASVFRAEARLKPVPDLLIDVYSFTGNTAESAPKPQRLSLTTSLTPLWEADSDVGRAFVAWGSAVTLTDPMRNALPYYTFTHTTQGTDQVWHMGVKVGTRDYAEAVRITLTYKPTNFSYVISCSVS